MSFSGGGYSDSDSDTATFLPLCGRHFKILQPSGRNYHLITAVHLQSLVLIATQYHATLGAHLQLLSAASEG